MGGDRQSIIRTLVVARSILSNSIVHGQIPQVDNFELELASKLVLELFSQFKVELFVFL